MIMTCRLVTVGLVLLISLSTTSQASEIRDRTGRDVAVLQAWIGSSVGLGEDDDTGDEGGLKIKASDCDLLARAGSVRAGCSRAVEEASRLSAASQASPLLGPAIHEWSNVNGRIMSLSGTCELVELRTVTPAAVMSASSFEGIGFYFGGAHEGDTYLVAKSRLHPVGQVTLRDGRSALVHRFIVQGFCFGQTQDPVPASV